MAKKISWAVLAIALAFGMTVVGCDDNPSKDDNDNKPDLSGFALLDNSYPVVGETITASYRKSSADPIGEPSWRWYKTAQRFTIVNDVENETFIGSDSTYTVKQSDAGSWIYAFVRYSGNSFFQSACTSSTVIGIPATANVSVSVKASRLSYNDQYPTLDNHRVIVTLTLSDGRWNDVSYSTASQWFTMSGTPSVSAWSNHTVNAWGRELVFTYNARSDTTLSINNLTATLDTTKLITMCNNTNVYNALTADTPSSVPVSQWAN